MIFLTPYILEILGEAEQITAEIVSGDHGMSAPEEKALEAAREGIPGEAVKKQS